MYIKKFTHLLEIKMGAGMDKVNKAFNNSEKKKFKHDLMSLFSKIIPGLYVGSIRDSRDAEQFKKHNITHVVTIYEDPKEGTIEV